MSVAEYGGIDLRPGGALAEQLSSQLAYESRQPVLALSSEIGAGASSPPLLTPGMASWYQNWVSPARGAAIGQVRSAFEAEVLPSGNRGFLMEAELDRIEARKQGEMLGERQTFSQRKEIADLDQEIERLETEYERKRAEHGRDAVPWAPVSYFVILALLMLALEGPINLGSFLSIEGFTPAFATGWFLVVAILFGVSGHLVGKVLRQSGERFGGHVSARVRKASIIELTFGIAALLVALGLVSYGRYFLLKDAIARQIALGGGEATIGNYLLVVGSLAANVGVYLVGLWWSWARHDPIPDFAEEWRRLQLLQARQRVFHRKELEPRLMQRQLQAQKDIELLGRRDAEQAQNLRDYGRLRQLFEEVRRSDSQVVGLLGDYRNRIVAATRDAGRPVRFTIQDPLRPSRSARSQIEAEDYLKQHLRLPCL